MLARIESTRSCRASCVTVARSAVVSGELVAVMGWSSEVGVQVEFAPGGFEETARPGGRQHAPTLSRSAFRIDGSVGRPSDPRSGG